jgi:hypothetical protein
LLVGPGNGHVLSIGGAKSFRVRHPSVK